MNFLYEDIDVARKIGNYSELPMVISDNMTSKYSIRPYQEMAFRNYITYYETPGLRSTRRNQTLFHMATGSGKTYIMAGLILYLYKQGYRDFLFFVPLSTIVSKTKDNFINKASSKYLFADEIIIDGKNVKIENVQIFEKRNAVTKDDIHICFTTIQALHSNILNPKEEKLSEEDFQDRKIVFISDEAHHLNVDTARRRNNDESISWESVVKKLFYSNTENVLLEFTATCDLNNPLIHEEYLDKIVFNYDLKQYRLDGYSKEIDTLQSGLTFVDMAIQALLFSQYRLKLFNEHRIDIKPIILFKSKTIKESKEFYKCFCETLKNLSVEKIKELLTIQEPIIKRIYEYFNTKEISLEMIVDELKESFNEEKLLMVNQESDVDNRFLNTLEEKNNPYRAIFEVDKLNEGWDVLNLFDIVRLYDTRDAKNGKPGKTTISEAQLIGRGARYCPFVLDDPSEKYIRKFDSDLENPMRICEELYYHCHTNSRYIDELHKALIENGLVDENVVTRHLKLKDEFKETEFYKHGIVMINEQVIASRSHVVGLPSKLKNYHYKYVVPSKHASIQTLMENNIVFSTSSSTIEKYTIKEIAECNYNVVHSAIRAYPRLRFKILKAYFPNLKSIDDFIKSSNYAADISIEFETDRKITIDDCFNACLMVFGAISEGLYEFDQVFEGTTTFIPKNFKSIFNDKKIRYSNPNGDGAGIPQSQCNQYRLYLGDKDWFVFDENYGTTEEKGFVIYFASKISHLQKIYSKIYLVRNERHMHIFSFAEGRRFEPDYLLFLIKNNGEKCEQLQVFIEPKGENLIPFESWKNDFLKEIEQRTSAVVLINDAKYKVIGLPFYNNKLMNEFEIAFKEKLHVDYD